MIVYIFKARCSIKKCHFSRRRLGYSSLERMSFFIQLLSQVQSDGNNEKRDKGGGGGGDKTKSDTKMATVQTYAPRYPINLNQLNSKLKKIMVPL